MPTMRLLSSVRQTSSSMTLNLDRSITADEVSVLSGSFVNKMSVISGDFSHQILATRDLSSLKCLPVLCLVDRLLTTGKISGKLSKTGDFEATIKASNSSVQTAGISHPSGSTEPDLRPRLRQPEAWRFRFALVLPQVLVHQSLITARTRTFLRLQEMKSLAPQSLKVLRFIGSSMKVLELLPRMI